MNNIQLNIVANAQFQQVYAEVAKLKEAMVSLQKASVGGPFTPANTASIRQAQQAFDSAVLSTRAFTIEHVAMSSSVEKFGKQLKSGQLSLSNYYKIWRDSAKGVSAELDTLAISQARLNRSIAIADPLRPGYAKLVTDINGVVTAQEKQVFYQRALNTALQQGSIKLIDFGKNTQWMGRQLTVGLTMPLALFGAGVANSFKQVDAELTRMQKVYGTGLVQPTQKALNQIRKDVQALGVELAQTLGTSVKETAAMAADLAATGLEGANLIGATKEAIRLSTLGELDHQQAMQATISLQNVYKLNTQGLTQAVNFLNAVENQTSTSLQDLVDAIPRVGPIVQQLGGSFKDTAAMMVAMKEAGVPAAQGANAIKSALASLINPSKNAQTAFKQFNIDLAGIAQKSGGAPIMMLKMLSDQMKGLDRLAQAQLIEKLFGKFQYARIQALLDNINKAGSQTATVFKLMGASSYDLANLASNELKQQTESASGRFKRMTETLKADLLPIGASFLKSFTAIGNAADKVLHVFQNIAKAIGPMAGLLGKIFGGGLAGLVIVGPLIMLVGLFSNLIGNIMRGANAIRMFRQGMDSAMPSENRFLAGLHGMRNFYEDLDKSAIAARNQMDLMPEAITSNATAFEVLRREIYLLTQQFTAFAAAQREAMGFPAVVGTGFPKSFVQETIPGFATGGWVPGSPSAGDVYPAMLTGQEAVIPAGTAKQYEPFINAMLSGNLPKYANGKVSAVSMKAAGMYKAPSSIQRQTPGLIWETMAAEKSAAEAAALPMLQKYYQDLVEKGKITQEKAEKNINNAIANLTRQQASHLSEEKSTMSLPVSGKTIDYKQWRAGNLAPDLGAVNNYVNTLRQRTSIINDFAASLQAAGKEIPTEELMRLKQGLPPLTAKQAKLLQDIAEYDAMVNESYQGAAAAGVLKARSGGDYYNKLAAGELAYNPALDARVEAEVQAKLARLDRNISEFTTESMVAVQEAVNKGVKNAVKIQSPSKQAYVQGELFGEGALEGMKSTTSQFQAAGRQLGSSTATAIEEVGISGGIGGIIGSSQTTTTQTSILTRLRGSKMAMGGAAMVGSMVAPMIINALPNTIGGTNISGAKTITSSIISGAGMGAMGFMSGNPVVGAAGTAIGALVGLFTGVADMIHQKQAAIQQQISSAVSRMASDIISSTLGMPTAIGNILGLLQKSSTGKQPSAIKTPASTLASLGKPPTTAAEAWAQYSKLQKAGGVSYSGTPGSSSPTAKDYKELTDNQQKSAQALTSIFQVMSGGQLNLKQYKDNLDAIKKSTGTNKEATAELIAGLLATGGSGADAFNKIKDKVDVTKTSVSDLMTVLTAMQMTSFDPTKYKTFTEALAAAGPAIEEYLKAIGKTGGGSGGGGGGGAVDHSKEFSKILKQYEGIRKLINAQAEAQKKYNDQLKLTNDYQLKQMDLFNQTKQAFTSGNYLQASLLQQSAQANQASYRSDLLNQKQQDALAGVDARIALIQEGQSSGLSLKQWLGQNKQFSTTATNDQLIKLFTGMASSKYTAQTDKLLKKSLGLETQGAAMTSGNPFNNLTINISADNSVVPAQFAESVAAAVHQVIQTQVAKNNTTNKIAVPVRSPKVKTSPKVSPQGMSAGMKGPIK